METRQFIEPTYPIIRPDGVIYSHGMRRLEKITMQIIEADISNRQEGIGAVSKILVQTAIKKAKIIIAELDQEYENIINK